MASRSSIELLVYHNPEAMAQGINPFDHGALHTDMWKTEGLKQALDNYGFDAAFGGARRDEEKVEQRNGNFVPVCYTPLPSKKSASRTMASL